MERTVSTGIAIFMTLMGLIIGFMGGLMYAGSGSEVISETGSDIERAASSLGDGTTDSSNQANDFSGNDGNAVAFTISVDSLSESQRSMLTNMGITGSEISVTYEMLACAEGKIGAARLEEIKNGATPSVSEGLQLMACY